MKDYIIRGIDKKGNLRLFVASTTNLVERARTIHNTSPTATAALGRSLTAAAMMGIVLKGDRVSLTFKIKGDGPLGNLVTVANNRGEVKGYVDYPYADVPSRADGKLDVGAIIGKNGQLAVIKDLGLKESYSGQSRLISGEIAEDLVHYFYMSEQQPSVISLGVLVDKDISVKASGGYILQLLPDADEEYIDRIEKALKNVKPISTLVDEGLTPEEIMETLFHEFEMEVLDKIYVKYKCECNRERIEKVLLSLGEKDIKNMIEEDGKAEIVCHFCNTKYNFSKDDLLGLIKY